MPDDTVAKVIPFCQVPDIIPKRLPGGGISLLAGAPNVGKTALLAGLLRDLRAGRPIFGHQPKPIPAIGIVNADRGWYNGAGYWLGLAGYGDIRAYSLMDDETFNMKRLRRKFERTDLLASFIDSLQLPPYSLVIVDPISLFLGGNLLDYDACSVACGEIRTYLRLRKLSMLATVHSGKLKTDKNDRYVRTSDQILGSTAIPGFTDAILHLASPEEIGKPYYALAWHPHCDKKEIYKLERDDQGLFLPYSGVDEANKRRVLSCLPTDRSALSLSEVVEQAQQFPLSQSTVQRVLTELVDDGLVEKVGHGKYAKIPVV